MSYISSSSSSSSLNTANEHLLELDAGLKKRPGYIWLAEEDNLFTCLTSERFEYLSDFFRSNSNTVRKIAYQVQKILNSESVKRCLQAKSDIILSKLQGKVITPKNQHLSVYLIFVHWVFEMVELYKVNFPDDSNVDRIKIGLLEAVAVWRYNLRDTNKKKDLLKKLDALANFLQNVYPDAQEFKTICDSFIELLTDNCETEILHWDPDIYPWSLINRDIPYSKLKCKNALNAIRVCSVSKNDFEKMWKYSCLVALEMWQTVIPIVERRRKITRQIMQIKASSLSKKEQKNIKASLDMDRSLEFIERWKERIYHILKRLEKSSLDNPLTLADEITEIQKVVTTIDQPSHFPRIVPTEETRAKLRDDLIRDGITNPEGFLKLAELNSIQMNMCHMLMDIAANANLRKIIEYWQAACADQKIAERDRKLDIEMEKARKASEELLKSIKGKKKKQPQHSKRKKAQPVKRDTESVKGVIECKELSVLPVSKPPVAKEQNIVLKRPHPFKSTLTKSSNEAIVLKACEADLYESFLDAVNSLVQEYGNDERHSFSLQRLSHNTMQLTMELALTYVNMLEDSDSDKLSHNLWTLFRKSGLRLDNRAVQELYLASFWTRFMREQHSQWISLQARGRQMPQVLQELVTMADQPKENDWLDPLKCRLVDVQKFTADICAGLRSAEEPIGKFPELDKLLPKLTAAKSIEIPALDELMKKVKGLLDSKVENYDTQKYLWIQQWSDDLRCLKSTYELLHSVTCPKQYALLVGNFHTILHAVVQSPLYALQVSKKGNHELSHNLIEIWKSLDNKMSTSVQDNLQYWLFNASNASRYPFECSTPQSEMHRIQLEAISGVLAPDLLDGFQVVQNQKSESSFDTGGTWLPKLKKCRPIEEQRKSLYIGLGKILQILLKELFPLL